MTYDVMDKIAARGSLPEDVALTEALGKLVFKTPGGAVMKFRHSLAYYMNQASMRDGDAPEGDEFARKAIEQILAAVRKHDTAQGLKFPRRIVLLTEVYSESGRRYDPGVYEATYTRIPDGASDEPQF